jgi:hypothetical protein
LLSAELIVRLQVRPGGVPDITDDASGAGLCVGPMMKLPSASGDGTSPSGSSVAVT